MPVHVPHDPAGTEGRSWVFVSHSHARAYGSDRVVLNGIHPDDYLYSETKQDYFLFMAAMNKAIDKGLDLALELSRRKGFRLIVAGTSMDYRHPIRRRTVRGAGAEYRGDVRGVGAGGADGRRPGAPVSLPAGRGMPAGRPGGHDLGHPVDFQPAGGTVDIVTPETGFLCERPGRVGRRGGPHRRDLARSGAANIGLEKYHYRRMVRGLRCANISARWRTFPAEPCPTYPANYEQFAYFDAQLGHPSWAGKYVLDFGGNAATF